MIQSVGIFESVQFLNESKSDIIISVNDIISNDVNEAEAIARIKKTLITLERSTMLTKDGINAIKQGINSSSVITKGMIKGGSNRKLLIRLANTIIETPSSDIEVMLANFIKEAKQEANNRLKTGLAIASVSMGNGYCFAF